jgi:eukaryotic-like serine/threonine-protein kinase
VSTGSSDTVGSHLGSQFPTGIPVRGEILADKYVVEGVVGTGGMGVVVAARHRQLGQTVAIKLLLGQEDEGRQDESRARFLREAQAAACLRSDHVVRIYDVGTLASGAPFMVMELLEGIDLGDMLDVMGPLPCETAVDYLVQACRAVATAHQAGIVHRDLKPSNLFVSKRSDGADLIKVLDFGISKSVLPNELDASLTTTRSVVGSPYYMSPEQVRDAKRVDARTDVWSLGMILYELIAGRPAFEADTLPAICAAIAADPPTPIHELRPELPIPLGQAIMRCLEKNLTLRVQSVDELVTLLAPFRPSRGAAPASLLDAAMAQRTRTTVPVSADAATLAPEWHGVSRPGKAPTVDSGVRPVDSADGVTDPTLRSPQSEPQAPPRRSRRAPLIAAGLAGLAGLVAIFVLRAQFAESEPAVESPAATVRPSEPLTERDIDPPSQGAAFQLLIDSDPSGGEVFEGDQRLGTAPVSVGISPRSVQSEPRRFTVRKKGHHPYTVIQGPSDGDVRVVARLTAVPEVAPSADPPTPSPVTPSRPRTKSAVRPASRPPSPATTRTESPAPDIRLER